MRAGGGRAPRAPRAAGGLPRAAGRAARAPPPAAFGAASPAASEPGAGAAGRGDGGGGGGGEARRLKALAGQLESERRLCVHQVGRAGVSPAVLASLDKALQANELVKVKSAGPEAGAEMEAALGCLAMRVTGGHWLIYRASAELRGRRRSAEVQLKIRDKRREWRAMKKHRQEERSRRGAGGRRGGGGAPAGGGTAADEVELPPDMVVVKRSDAY